LSNIKVSTVIASSPEGWEGAARRAVARADKTIVGIRDVEVTRLSARVEDGVITEYIAEMNITFVIDSDLPLHE
jgi:flavin-binding protein dodecin